MSIFNKALKGLTGGLGSLEQLIANPGKILGTNDLIGGALNDITGTSDSARQQYQYNKALQEDAQAFNAQQAELERNWQTEMSNTARQRAVSDLQKAGLNPILASGAEASSGAGAAATSPGASTGAGQAAANPISMIQALVSTINSAKKTEAEVEKIEHEITNIDANTNNTNKNTENGGTGGTTLSRSAEWIEKKIKSLVHNWSTSSRKAQENYKKNGLKQLKALGHK